MAEKAPALLIVGPGPALRWAMEELKRRYRYKLCYASDPYEASFLLGVTPPGAIICEAGPAYSSGCRLIREISFRSAHLPVFVFVEPEAEEYVFDEMARGACYLVRSSASLESFHQLITEVIARHRAKAA
jgi:DNA-binding NtrC family response regulator